MITYYDLFISTIKEYCSVSLVDIVNSHYHARYKSEDIPFTTVASLFPNSRMPESSYSGHNRQELI